MAQNFGATNRSDFPLLASDRSLVYLDSAASAQKPQVVIDAEKHFYEHDYANVHRGVYRLAERSTELFEASRELVREFLSARSTSEIVFTRGTTEAVNLVAASWGGKFISKNDEIVVTVAEHHSNFVPWQLLAGEVGARVKYVPLDGAGDFSLPLFLEQLSPRTKLVAVSHIANGLGVRSPVNEIIRASHDHGAVVLLDSAQAVAHEPIDVSKLDVDFLAFSGHKIYGPTGIGCLYGKSELLDAMPPFQSGGEMIRTVSIAGTTFNSPPQRFEAGTPNIAGAVGLGAAIQYVQRIGLDKISRHEHELVRLLEQELLSIPGVHLLGPIGSHHALVCFTTDGVHPHDIAQYLSQRNICVRAGHHCAQPLLEHFGIGASTRASLALYNTPEDVQTFGRELREAIAYFR